MVSDLLSSSSMCSTLSCTSFQAVRKLNPAADPRAMRRVIAEDPEWNLETVPPLVDACINHIVSHFHGELQLALHCQ